jgi:radical SAM protein with 4Fe4S-binding SPASM domain
MVWEITKNQIEICKDCELRYICQDCRAYTIDENNKYSKPLKCKYDQYQAVWN